MDEEILDLITKQVDLAHIELQVRGLGGFPAPEYPFDKKLLSEFLLQYPTQDGWENTWVLGWQDIE